MKTRSLLALVVTIFAVTLMSSTVSAQSSSRRPTPLNEIRIGRCIDPGVDEFNRAEAARGESDPAVIERKRRRLNSASLERLIEAERRYRLVLDVRPFAINQSTGKLQFDGRTGDVSAVHFNPFVYKYEVSVKQQELVSSAINDFIDILLPPNLRQIGRLQAGIPSESAVRGDLEVMGDQLKALNLTQCAGEPKCDALQTMKTLYEKIQTSLGSDFTVFANGTPAAISDLEDEITALRDEEMDAYMTCKRAEDFNRAVDPTALSNHFSALNNARGSINRVDALTDSLSALATEYLADPVLNAAPVIRCGGFSCAKQFQEYAEAVRSVLEGYEREHEQMLADATNVKLLYDTTNKMKDKEGVFARTFTIIKRFELSEATVSVSREKNEKEEPSRQARNEQPSAPSSRPNPRPAVTGRPVNNHALDANNADAGPGDDEQKKADNEDQKKEDGQNGSNQVSQSIQLGRPRFLVSGGLVYSPLPRQSFVSASGFVRDADGNPVGDGNKSVVSFGENSSRRVLPMVVLNTRLATFKPASVFFSLGVTAKDDQDIDVEYLLGPSVSMLNDRAMFTFGAYAGKNQSLVPDVKVGDEIPDSAGNAILSTKRYSWKPGFSFSYVFSNVSKRSEAASSDDNGDGSATERDDLSEEIRIGGVPFNLAMGLVYTSLEDQTFAPVLGLARDRQGNLTDGQNLTRIAGFSTTSNSRLVPMAMLHTRLINFGRHSFYLTSGVSGKKSDENIEVEYLLGGSVNIFRRKMFLTFGTFAGKQQVLGGDLFPGAKLDPNQDVTKQTRYVWKPAFGFSFDISRITRVGQKQ